jgi:hypothetical protein
VLDPKETGKAAGFGRTGLQIDALQSLQSDPSAMAALSPLSRVLLSTLQTGFEAALGPLSSIGQTALQLGASLASDAASEAVAAVADIPMVGAFVGFLIKLIASVIGGGVANDAAYCQQFMDAMRPAGTGSLLGGSQVVPADIFAAVHSIPPGTPWLVVDPGFGRSRATAMGGTGLSWVYGCSRYASSLGSALTTILEGCPADELDVDPRQLAADDPWFRQFWPGHGLDLGEYPRSLAQWPPYLHRVLKKSDARYLDDMSDDAHRSRQQRLASALERGFSKALQGEASHSDDFGYGVSVRRRSQFRKLRRAIRSGYGPTLPKGSSSDGGVALWGAYLDLLLVETNAGRLPVDYLASVLVSRGGAYQVQWVLPMFGTDATYKPPGVDRGCASALADQVAGLVASWSTTIRPYYQQGRAQLADLTAQANSIASKSAQRFMASARKEAVASVNAADKGTADAQRMFSPIERALGAGRFS